MEAQKPLNECHIFLFVVGKTYWREASIIISIFRWKPKELEAGLGSEQTQEFPSGGLTENMEVICGMKMAGVACFHQKAMEKVGSRR